jgi:hypothetical protein
MRQPILRCQPGNLVTAKEAGAKNKRLGLKGVQKPRGYGHGATPAQPAGEGSAKRFEKQEETSSGYQPTGRAEALSTTNTANT